MRYRVMHMQQIQRLGLKHFKHLGRQRQRIRGMVKQGIRRHFDFMKMGMRVVGIHADWRRITNEVNIVPTCS